MLIVKRRVDEVVRIGQNIRVMVTAVNRQQVSIGIEAPANVPVLREEIVSRYPPRGPGIHLAFELTEGEWEIVNRAMLDRFQVRPGSTPAQALAAICQQSLARRAA